MLTTILIALDCSNSSETVVQGLKQLQLNDTTQIIFIHVLPMIDREGLLEADRPAQFSESHYAEIETQLRQYMANFPKSILEITQGDPAEEIIRLANIYQSDLIVLGTRGLTGVTRIIEDSVSSSVVADAPCSVFVVKV